MAKHLKVRDALRPMPVLVDDDLQLWHLVVGLVQQDYLIGVCLDRPGLTQIGRPRSTVLATRRLPVRQVLKTTTSSTA